MFEWKLTNNDTGDIEVLTDDPKGWEEIQFIHNRSEKFDGMFFDFSQSLSFGCKGSGKEFVDEAYDSKGSEADVSLDITYNCDAAEKTIKSKLNFSSYAQQIKDGQLYSVVDVEKVGITQVVQNRSDTDVDLLSQKSIGGTDLNEYDFLDLNMHSKLIRQESEWKSESHGCCFHLITGGLKAFTITPTANSVTADLTRTESVESQCKFFITTENIINGSSIVNLRNNNVINTPQTASITWDIKGQVTSTTYDVTPILSVCAPDNCATGPINGTILYDSIDIALRVYFGNPDSTNINEASQCGADPVNEDGIKYLDLLTIPTYAAGTNPQVKSFDSGLQNMDIILNPGDKIWYYWVVDLNLNSACDMKIEFEYQESLLNIVVDSSNPETTAKTLPIHESWSRICEGITDQTLAFKSEFFGRTNSQGIAYNNNGYGSFTGITDGLRIRGFEQVDSTSINDGAELQEGQTKKGIITNLDDMYDSCQTIWGVGLGIETHDGQEVVRVEEKTYFYSDDILLTFDDVPNIEMSFLEDKAYSGVEVGYAQWKPELKNGLDEPNTKAEWVFPKIKSIDNVKTFTSPYVAAMYAIETTRRKHITFETSDDTRYDDEIFIIALNRDTSGVDYTVGEPTFIKPDVPGEAEQNEDITVNRGLIDPDSAYNLRFNLFSCFSRVMNQFTNGLTKDATQGIDYSYFEGNGSMNLKYVVPPYHAGEFNGQDFENVQNTTYEDGFHMRKGPIVLPEQYTFTYPVSFPDYIKICDNPRGKIRFSSDGVNYFEGWINNLEYSIKTGMTNFTIIRSGS